MIILILIKLRLTQGHQYKDQTDYWNKGLCDELTNHYVKLIIHNY